MSHVNIARVTLQALDANHSLLLHRRSHHLEGSNFEYCDGRAGAVVGNGEWFVTSPNMDFVPQPPVGRIRSMHIRADYRYGEDDPLQWPQPYVLSNCHLGVIPLRPGPDDYTSIMWWIPEPDDFQPTTAGLITGLGLLSRGRFDDIQNAVSSLRSRAQIYMDQETNTKSEVIPSLLTVLMQGLSRLQTLHMTCRQVFMSVSYVQRCSIELIAALDYLEVFRPRMRGLTPPVRMVGLRMGVFTHDPLVIQDFMLAGLPVWFIRRYDILHTAIITSVKDVRLPEDYLQLHDACPPFDPFFIDRADHPKRFHALHSYLRSFFSYPNPFDTVDEVSVSDDILPSTSKQPSTPLASRTTKPKPSYHQPYTGKPKPSPGRNKFIEEENPLIPPAIAAWKRALAKVDTDPRNQVGYFSRPSDAGYAFPEPGVIYGGQTPERQAKLLQGWLRQRPALIYRLTSSSSTVRVLSNQNWRTLLSYGNTPVSLGSQEQTKSARRRADMRQLLGNCLDESGVELVSASDQLFWREQELSTGVLPSLDICQEVLWELYELNFRFELLALHSRAQVAIDDSPEWQDRVAACFPGQGPLLVADSSLANQGLAAPSMADRTPYLLALKKLMKGWKGNAPLQIGYDEKPMEQYSAVELTVLESAVAKFYTQSFFNFFGRAAIVPHGLRVATAGV